VSLNPDACHSLLEDIVYHAVKDLEALNENSNRVYTDDDHRAFCNARGFACGRDELTEFFDSFWFLRICDEFQDLSADMILSNINL
jgi:hypothetical protein